MEDPTRRGPQDMRAGGKMTTREARPPQAAGDVGPELVSDRPLGLTVFLVESRAWTREALAHALEKADRRLEVRPIPNPAMLAAMDHPAAPAVILFSVSSLASEERGLPECVAAMRLAMPGLPVVALAEDAKAEDILLALGRGLSGYILTTIEGRHLAMALHFVANGGIYVPAEPLLRGLDLGSASAPPVDVAQAAAKVPSSSLTPRESAVLGLLREGMSNKQVARALGLREPTVKVHVHNVLLKLGVTNRTQLALLASR
jgi:DNA-binding NarL/FixJ family response regulator